MPLAAAGGFGELFDVYVLTFGGAGFATTSAGFAIRRLALEQFIAAAAGASPAKSLSMRLGAILAFVDPRRLRQAHVRALSNEGLTTDGISALARLVAFHGYQSDLLADAIPGTSLDPRDCDRHRHELRR